MKKLFLFTVIVLAFAATAYSQDKLDFRASGFIDMSTFMWQWNNFYGGSSPGGVMNVTGNTDKPPFALTVNPVTGVTSFNPTSGGQWNRTSSYVSSRGRLKFDALMGKDLSGTIFFELDSQTWGDTTSGTVQQRNRLGYLQGDRAGVEVKNFYFDVGIPYIPIPMTARFGLQPFGIRSNLFMYSDGTGITVSAKADPVEIIGYWMKALEGKIATSDDVNAWGLTVRAKVDTFTLGAYGWYWKIQEYPLNAADFNQANYGTISNPIRGPMWWFAAYADGKLGPVNLNFDFIYDTGHLKNEVVPVPKVNFSGWASRVKVDYPWEAFNFGFVGMYATGADARKTSQFGTPGEFVQDPASAAAGVLSTKVGSYVVPIQSETGADDSEVLFAGYISGGFGGWAYVQDNNRLSKGTYGGLWFAKLYGAYKASPEFKITLQGLYIGDTTKHGDTMGFALNSTGGLKNGSTVGWELDLINEWQVYRNLVFRFGGGFLIPGNAMTFTGSDPSGTLVSNEKPNTPWIFTTRLIYSF